MIVVADCSNADGSVAALKTVAVPWDYDDLDFLLWDPAYKGAFVSYNDSSNEFVAVDYSSGKVTVLSSKPTILQGIVSAQASALDTATSTAYSVFVDADDNPSTYKIMIADVKTGNITNIVDTEGNMDFAFMFLA